jgi:hypothetical protein
MFQRLEELQTGSLFILTGQAGAGKSHLAASARRSGTLWVLDTEGAAQNLQSKPGIHKRIQVLQTLSLRALTQAMDEIRRQGKPGDTVLLDSVSKVFQAMRAYAQQRAGSDTDRKTIIDYNEHASVNRNMQLVYTALTSLKQAGFHVIIIGHLARKYRAHEDGLQDEGLRVLADEQIAYEADAILLVERDGDERSVTPIIKPPRPAHLQLNQQYPAELASLYPDLAPPAKSRKEKKTGKRGSDTQAAEAEAAPDEETDTEIAAATESASQPPQPPRSPDEAERRFYARYGEVIGGNDWKAVQRYLGALVPHPSSIEEWIAAAEQVRERARGNAPVIAA